MEQPTEHDLRALYVDQRLTTRQIGDMFGVSKTSVLRWLRAYGIDRRAPGHGVANTGKIRPDVETLNRLVHVEHIPLTEIAARYDVSLPAVRQWLARDGIPSPAR